MNAALSSRLIVLGILGTMGLIAATTRSCACTPSEECQLIRGLCKVDLCVKSDSAGWADCAGRAESCDVDTCTTRGDCLDAFFARCTARMQPGMPGYVAYSACGTLDCSTPTPAPSPLPDGPRAPPPDAAVCAGVPCGGSCCTAYPCFSGKRCTCMPSVAECAAQDAGTQGPALSPACCSDAPLCSAQGKLCCFVPASAETAAQTRCLASCAASRHCTFAPYLQDDAASSCLPPPYSTEDIPCPF